MEAKASLYIPAVFRSFQGFQIKDIKEFRIKRHMELILESEPTRRHDCARCGSELGRQDGRYWLTVRHMRVMGWTVSVSFWREKRRCGTCKKIRSERIDFICEQTPHISCDLAWWINRLSEITSVLQVSRLESIDKMACYRVDKEILLKLLQGYKIPEVTMIGVDEVYGRGPRQLKEGESREDLFLTIIVDLKTHKVIWVSQSRRKRALDEFFELIGPEACQRIEAVATDQHRGYQASVEEYCPQALVVWDRFHLVQQFNEALNEDRRAELEQIDTEGEMGNLMNNKFKYVFLTKAHNRSLRDQRHIDEVTRKNHKMSRLEVIKEHFHKIFDCHDVKEAQIMLSDVYQWAMDAHAKNIWLWVKQIREQKTLWNYFKCKITTGVNEGINRLIKGIKWQAYGYKDMQYFALKILQKAGYLNHRYILASDK